MDDAPYVSRRYQALKAHTNECYRAPIAAFAHTDDVALRECVDAAVGMGYGRDVTTAVAMTLPQEFLIPSVLITRLECPTATNHLLCSNYNKSQARKTRAAVVAQEDQKQERQLRWEEHERFIDNRLVAANLVAEKHRYE